MYQVRKVPKLVKVISSMVLAVMFISSVTMFAGASYQDELVELATAKTRNSAAVRTRMREKEDYTSSYAYNMKSTVGFSGVVVLGSNQYTGQSVLSYHWDDRAPYTFDCTYGAKKSLPKGAAYYFPNMVKERGYKYAGLELQYNYGNPYIYVWWSPDSI